MFFFQRNNLLDRHQPVNYSIIAFFCLLTLWGQYLGYAWYFYTYSSQLTVWLFQNGFVSDSWATLLSKIYASFLFANAAFLCLSLKNKVQSWWSIQIVLSSIVSLLLMAEAGAISLLGGRFGSNLALLTHSLRIVAPIGLTAIAIANTTQKVPTKERWIQLVKLSISLTFVAHGIEALALHPTFIDYLISFAENWLKMTLSEFAASQILRIIGCIDIITGILLILRPNRVLLVWLGFWGLTTGLNRILFAGPSGIHEFFIRFSHAACPWILILLNEKELKPWIHTFSPLKYIYKPTMKGTKTCLSSDN